MALTALVTTGEMTKTGKIRTEEYDVVEIMGDSDGEIAVRLEELMRSVSESLEKSISAEAELTLEVSGSMSLRGSGEARFLFFNVGGTGTTSNSLKVVLRTSIAPKKPV